MELKYLFIVSGSANAICRLPFGLADREGNTWLGKAWVPRLRRSGMMGIPPSPSGLGLRLAIGPPGLEDSPRCVLGYFRRSLRDFSTG
jgi:hypothetical protein